MKTIKLKDVIEPFFGTRIVQRLSGGSIYPVYGGGNITFYSDTYNREDDLVISRFAMSKNCVRFVSGKFFLNDSGFTVKLISNFITKEYLFWFLFGNQDKIYNCSRGVAQKNIDIQRFLNLEIPVPSLDEQNRIGQVISKSSSILSLRRDSLFAVNKLERSLFLDMFGDPIANPKNWEICKLGHLIKKIETGKNIKPVEDGTLDGFRVLKLSAVTKGVFKPEESKPLSDDYTPPESHFVKEGDFLFGRANTTELVGAVALVEEEHPNLLLPDKIWRINWDVNKVTNEYMYSLFWTESFKRKLGSISSGTGGSMKNISQGKFLELLVPLPPMEIQARFVEKVHSIKKYKKNLLVSSNRFQVLQSSLISKYFP